MLPRLALLILGALPTTTLAQRPDADIAARVQEILQTRCLDCHGGVRPDGRVKVNGGIKVLDRELLIKKKVVVPGKPEESLLFKRVSSKDEDVMPPAERRPLSDDDKDLIRRWIAAGAPPLSALLPLPPRSAEVPPPAKGQGGVEYVLGKILAHVRGLPEGQRPFVRFFSINHLLAGGVTRAELDLHRDALVKAINHLSREPDLVALEVIDPPSNSVFAVDIRGLGWNRRPFQRLRDGKPVGASEINLFDLALLEYPYGALPDDSAIFADVEREFLALARQVRPIPYVRADWFVSVCTQPPIYEDFLRLPRDLTALERDVLHVDSRTNVHDAVARRGGVTVSGVSRNNRVMERHPTGTGGYYWKSFDFRSSKLRENVLRDPIRLDPAGGEMIFSLPNGLQGYFIANGAGERLEFAPTDIVTDRFAADKTVRNGLACMRCHDRGMKEFSDTVRPALEHLRGDVGFDRDEALALYASHAELEEKLKQDSERFNAALSKLLGSAARREPLSPVSQRYLDAELSLRTAAGELGLEDIKELAETSRLPALVRLGLGALAADGALRRDQWDEAFAALVRQLGLGTPLEPLDGQTYREAGGAIPIDVVVRTNRRGNVFTTGDRVVVFVENRSSSDLYIELIVTNTRGQIVQLVPASTVVPARSIYRFPATGHSLAVREARGKEVLTLWARPHEFPGGEVLRGDGVADRFVHPFGDLRRAGKRVRLQFDPSTVLKRTVEIETR
jgi:serine/threonine-protein kinase